MAKIVTDRRARQGPPGRPVLAVLIGALVLCGIAIVGYLAWVSMSTPDLPSQKTLGAPATGAPSPVAPPASSGSMPAPVPANPKPSAPQ